MVLPVFNGEKYLSAAVSSVLEQTCSDFELVVVDDGSTDRTGEILAAIADPRLRVIRHPRNCGLVAALNEGIRNSGGEFVARMDADDLCHPSRFAKQVAFMEAHPNVSICGTWFRTFGAKDAYVRSPVAPEHIRARLFFGWAVGHPTLMIRRAFLERSGLGFDEAFRHCEDYDLLERAAGFGQIACLPDFLVSYRIHDAQVSAIRARQMSEKADCVRLRQARRLLGGISSAESDLHRDLATGVPQASMLSFAERWLFRLDQANRESGTYHADYFRTGLEELWYRAHAVQAASIGAGLLRSYWNSPMRSLSAIGWRRHARLAAKSLIPKPLATRWAR